MKSLYESILDTDAVEKQDMPLLQDQYKIYACHLDRDDYGDIRMTDFFDWRKVQTECKKLGYQWAVHDSKWKVDNQYYGELIALWNNVYALGFEQNIFAMLKMYVKNGFDVQFEKKGEGLSRNCLYLIYHIKSKNNLACLNIRIDLMRNKT